MGDPRTLATSEATARAGETTARTTTEETGTRAAGARTAKSEEGTPAVEGIFMTTIAAETTTGSIVGQITHATVMAVSLLLKTAGTAGGLAMALPVDHHRLGVMCLKFDPVEFFFSGC